MSSARREKPCTCAACSGVATADPDWGFDLARIPKTTCLLCKKRIGKKPYLLDAGVARFGPMFIVHESCVSPAEAKKMRTEYARITARQSMRRHKGKR